jgi:hypothetical protein
MFGGSGKEAMGAEMSPGGTLGGVFVGSPFRKVLLFTDVGAHSTRTSFVLALWARRFSDWAKLR